MPLTRFAVDDGPHNMDGLLLHARDGGENVEAFISRLVMDRWVDPIETRAVLGWRKDSLPRNRACKRHADRSACPRGRRKWVRCCSVENP